VIIQTTFEDTVKARKTTSSTEVNPKQLRRIHPVIFPKLNLSVPSINEEIIAPTVSSKNRGHQRAKTQRNPNKYKSLDVLEHDSILPGQIIGESNTKLLRSKSAQYFQNVESSTSETGKDKRNDEENPPPPNYIPSTPDEEKSPRSSKEKERRNSNDHKAKEHNDPPPPDYIPTPPGRKLSASATLRKLSDDATKSPLKSLRLTLEIPKENRSPNPSSPKRSFVSLSPRFNREKI